MRTLKNKKGFGMELAIFVLLVVFAFCSLIISMAYASVSSNKSRLNDLKVTTALDRIGEQFVTFMLSGEQNFTPDNPEEYNISSIENNTVTVTADTGKILTVKVEDGKIVCWQYSKN